MIVWRGRAGRQTCSAGRRRCWLARQPQDGDDQVAQVGGIINSGLLMLDESSLTGNRASINGGGLNTQASGVSRITQSQFVDNVSGGLGGGMSNLGTTTLYGTSVRFNTGSRGGGIATGNANVTLNKSIVTSNTPDNCNPLNTILGCVN